MNHSRVLLLLLTGLVGACSPLFCHISLASPLYSGQIGYYCPPYTYSIENNSVVMFNAGQQNCHYIGQNMPLSTSWFGAWYLGIPTNAIQKNGHALGGSFNVSNFDSTQIDNYDDIPYGANLFVAIYDYGACYGMSNYLQNGGTEPCTKYGVLSFTKGTQDTLNFTSPIGNYSQSYIPVFTAQYGYSASSTWNYIDVEVSQHSSTATSSIISTQHISGHIQDTSIGSHILSFGDTELTGGCYTYRGRFMTQIGGLPPTPAYINYSQYSENSAWQFCLGTGNSLTLPTGEQCDDYGLVGGALCRVALWLFIPKPSTLQKFADLKDILLQKFPFGYFTSIKEKIATLNSTTTPVFNLGTTTPLTAYIFGPFKLGLAWLLWIIFAFWLIRKISNFNF